MKKTFLTVSAAVFFVFFFSSSPASGGDFTWNPVINLSAAGQHGLEPQVTMDETGHAIAVWSRSDGSNYIIQSRASSDYGVSWSSAVNLSAAGREAYNPQVTMDETGRAVAVWRRFDGSNDIIQSRASSDHGVTWSPAVDLSAAGRNAHLPQVTMDATGNAVAVWYRYDGSNFIIQASRFDVATDSWSSPVNLSAAGQGAYLPQVTMDETGNAVVVWRRYDGSNDIIQASRFDVATDSWSSPVNLSAAGQSAGNPQVTMDATGNAIAVWYRYDGSNYVIQASRFDVATDSWSSADDLSAAGQDAIHPQVATDATGNAVVVWRRYDGSNDIIQASRFDVATDSWSSPVNLSAAGQDAVEPHVTVDETGHAIAVWYRHDGFNGIIQSSVSSDHGDSWSAPTNLSAAAEHGSDPVPQVTMDETGHAVAVWYLYDGSNYIIQASALADTDADGIGDLLDECPEDAGKIDPGECGCGVADTDSDDDGTPDCNDVCPNDPDDDVDGDGVCGDVDNCPTTGNPNQADANLDGVGDACSDEGDGARVLRDCFIDTAASSLSW
jgi:hypothetical protein